MTGSNNYLVFHCEATELISYKETLNILELADDKVCRVSLLQFINNRNLTKIITVPMLSITDLIQPIF